MISSEKIKDFLYRFKKFLDLFVFQLLNKQLNVKRILRKFELFFKVLEIGDKKIPWIPIKAKIWLDKILKPDMISYEYGSGLSTLYFSTRVKQIISVEHNKSWYDNISNELLKMNIHNCKYHLIEPEYINKKVSKQVNKDYRSSLIKYSKFSFLKYVESIDKYQDHYFDFVFIDGRARMGCIKHSINKIKRGGYLMLDNSDESKFKSAKKLLKKYEKLDFYGIAPSNPYLEFSKISYSNATVWKIT